MTPVNMYYPRTPEGDRERKLKMAQRTRDWQRMPWAERKAWAMAELQRAMTMRGYPLMARPVVRCFRYHSTGRPFYVIRLVNQGRERRRSVYIAAERWDTLIQRLCFRQWKQLSGTRIERIWL